MPAAHAMEPPLSFKPGEGNQLLHPSPTLFEGIKHTDVSQPGEALSLSLLEAAGQRGHERDTVLIAVTS